MLRKPALRRRRHACDDPLSRVVATLSQLRNIDSKRLVKKISHLDADNRVALPPINTSVVEACGLQ